MNKAIKYAINGALIGGLIKAIINANSQLENKSPDTNFDWNKCFIEFGKGALLGAGTGLVIGSIKDEQMSEILIGAGGASNYIGKVLNNYTDNDTSLPKKAAQIQYKLNKKFGAFLSEYPSLNGSVKEGTSITGSDIDIQLKFNRNTGTIKEVRDYVEEYLNENFKDNRLTKVRSQNHSVGLFFKFGDETKRIDIIPMREIENGKGDTFLYSINDSTIRKTNASKQRKVLTFSQKERNMIKLLKGWKLNNNIVISSTLIKFMVKRAFSEISVPRARDKAILSIIKFIGDKITSIRIIDPANTNNIISDSLSLQEKEQIKQFCLKMHEDITKDSRNIIDYFPDI